MNRRTCGVFYRRGRMRSCGRTASVAGFWGLVVWLLMGCGGDHAADPTPPPAPPPTLESLDLDFVWIEPGRFLMGSPASEPGHQEDESPPHEVEITWGFWIGRYEVTQGQWEAVMGTRPWEGQSFVVADPRRPAVYVSWADARDFVQRLNLLVGEELYFLPTEAEWEYACRGGTRTAWSFGDDAGDLGTYAWFQDNAWSAGLRAAQPVGTRKPNPWGLYDCHGNVWEWVYDIYGNYPDTAQTNPTGASSGSYNVIRGGSFFHPAAATRSASRDFDHYRYRDSNLGFRILRLATDPD